MSKIYEIIKDKSLESIIEKLLLLLWLLFLPLLLWLQDFASNIAKFFSKEFLLISSLVFLSLFLLSISFVIRLRKKLRNDLKQALGVYWDKNLNTYCPNCKKLLTNYAYYREGRKSFPGFKCIGCKDVIRLSAGNKIFLTIEEAQEIVKDLFKK